MTIIDRIQMTRYSIAARERTGRSSWENALWELAYLPVKALAQLPVVTASARKEARSITVTRTTIGLRQWPPAFNGLRVAFLSDLHASLQTPCAFLEQVADETNRLKPDLILLGGDYVTRGTKYIKPMAQVLGKLKAPLGVFGVMGNHDYVAGIEMVRSALNHVGIVDVTNSGRWLSVNGSRVRIAGVGDLWHDRQDLDAALAGVRDNDPVILLSHNPDYVMQLMDLRVGLVLSGHTHGGQIQLPGIGPVVTNSRYGSYLLSGLISIDILQLFVSRGVGTVVVPLRHGSPPEIALLTLKQSDER